MPDPKLSAKANNQPRDRSGRFAASGGGGSGGRIELDPFNSGAKPGKKLQQFALQRASSAAHYPSKADFDNAHAAATRARTRRRSNPADAALRKVIMVPHDHVAPKQPAEYRESIEDREAFDQQMHEELWGKKRRK